MVIANPAMKARIRETAEAEEREFHSAGGGDERLAALEPIRTGVEKPHLPDATVPAVAKRKKPLEQMMTVLR